MKQNSKLKLTLKTYQNDRVISTIRTGNIRRFRRKISFITCPKDGKFYLSVNYGDDFKNDGFYQSKEEVLFALRAFLEKGLLEYLDSSWGLRHRKEV